MKRISQNIMFPYFMFFDHYAKTFLLRFLADEKKDTDREIDRIRVGLGDKENKIIYREL